MTTLTPAVAGVLERANQSHLVQFFPSLGSKEQKQLQDEVLSLDLIECCNSFRKCIEAPVTGVDDSELEPIPREDSGSISDLDISELDKLWNLGTEAIAKNEVGVILLAGGQGTRLGVDYPKGMFSVGLPSDKTLFQLQAERILKLQELAKLSYPNEPCLIRWYIMTSSPTDAATKAFFSTHNNFGLLESQITYFQQGTMPCFTMEGKIILHTKHSLAMAPDGNGGLYKALRKCKVIDDMKVCGLKYLHVYCVDNVLVKVADPTFLGFCVSKGADCGAKVVERIDPKEPVGVVCRLNGKPSVVEYSEISTHTAELRDPLNSKKLAFRAGNICNHFFTVEFLDRVSSCHENDLIHHVAKKKIPFTDDNGVSEKPDKPNGIKMEKFVFDVFQFSKKFVLWETIREEEFSPLKNADSAGKDCSSTCRDDVFRLHAKWIESAGAKIVHSGHSVPVVEVAPFLSYGGENLSEIVAGKTLNPPIYLGSETCSSIVNGEYWSSGASTVNLPDAIRTIRCHPCQYQSKMPSSTLDQLTG